jgi:hypothetical protein
MRDADPALQSDALHRRVRAAIDAWTRGAAHAESFEAIALDVARYQLEHVPPVARLAAARGIDATTIASIEALPALPTDVFRLRRVAAHPASLDTRVFRTSGTTQGAERRGEHPLRDVTTYARAALAWGEPMLLAAPRPQAALVLAPSARDLPDSSLSFMIELFVARLGIDAQHLVSPTFGLDVEALARGAREAASRGQPTLVLGTSFAFVHALDALGRATLPLPAGSRAMLTGGFKGRSRVVSEAELRERIGALFGLDPSAIVGEYGMTELSSQLYEPRLCEGRDHAPGLYRPPPWLWVSAADPDTLAPLPRGREGIARFVDLANVDGALAVQTQDRVRIEPNGDVRLFGRAEGAPPRGCSIAIDELLSVP